MKTSSSPSPSGPVEGRVAPVHGRGQAARAARRRAGWRSQSARQASSARRALGQLQRQLRPGPRPRAGTRTGARARASRPHAATGWDGRSNGLDSKEACRRTASDARSTTCASRSSTTATCGASTACRCAGSPSSRRRELLTAAEIEPVARAAVVGRLPQVPADGRRADPAPRPGRDRGAHRRRARRRRPGHDHQRHPAAAAGARRWRAAGLRRVNVHVDTLDPERLKRLMRFGTLAEIEAGIAAAEEAGLAPIKLNCVVTRDYNDAGRGGAGAPRAASATGTCASSS